MEKRVNLAAWDLSLCTLWSNEQWVSSHFKTETHPFQNGKRGVMQRKEKQGYVGSGLLSDVYFSHFPFQRKMMFQGVFGSFEGQWFNESFGVSLQGMFLN